MYLFNPNGDLTVMHMADYNRLGAVVGALCGERDFSRSCNLPLGQAICRKCDEVAAAVEHDSAHPCERKDLIADLEVLRAHHQFTADRVGQPGCKVRILAAEHVATLDRALARFRRNAS